MNQYEGRWTPETVKTLERLWAEGLSARQIGHEMGLTRNAVIGKVTRMRQERPTDFASRKVATSSRKPKPRSRPTPFNYGRRAKPSTPFVPRVVRPVPPEIPPLNAKMLPLMELTDETCKWPIGDPKEPGFGFCGMDTWRGSRHGSYCPRHYLMAYQPPERRR